jgi:protein-tyrosine-phosphatase
MRTILFVCPHGAATSVLAAADFNRLARERGVAARATSAGTEPDPAIAPRVVAELLKDGMDLRDERPWRVTREDVAAASRVVTFGCELGDLVLPGVPVEDWDVPAVSADFAAARAAIAIRLESLLSP